MITFYDLSFMCHIFSKVMSSSTLNLQVSLGEDQVSVVPLDDPLDLDCDAACLDKELKDLVSLVLCLAVY